MCNVFIHVTMSLDQLIARSNDDIDCAFHYGTDSIVYEVLEEIGAVFLGNQGLKEGTIQISRLPYGAW